MCICLQNRNNLAHSIMPWGSGAPVLFKMSKQGRMHGAKAELKDLRQIADDMDTYARYGRNLANSINCRLKGSVPIFPFHGPINQLCHVVWTILQTHALFDVFIKAVAARMNHLVGNLHIPILGC